jgi:hypothetical protein
MAQPEDITRDPGASPRKSAEPVVSTTDWFAAAFSLVWVLAVAGYFLAGPINAGTLGYVFLAFMVFLPLVLLWAVVTTLRSIRTLRAESARLQATVEAMRGAYLSGQGGMRPSVERKLDELAASAKHTESALASFNSRRDSGLTVPSADRKAALVAPQAQPEAEQPGLALGTPAEALQAPLSVRDFIRAVQFPENPDDKEGFRALRSALEDRNVAKLIRAAQDVLTLLSQEGIYMDDLKPDRTRPDVWRRFAAGERGRGIAALGGVRDRSSLALTAGRMREDPIFRDAAHHFLRTFDRIFSEFEKAASDAELSELAETRTARAFMLFGRATGTFD